MTCTTHRWLPFAERDGYVQGACPDCGAVGTQYRSAHGETLVQIDSENPSADEPGFRAWLAEREQRPTDMTWLAPF